MTSAAPGSATEGFALLGLGPDADRAAIEAAYRRLVAEAHPDRHAADGPGGVAAATLRTQALNDARRAALAAARERTPPPRPVGATAHLRPQQPPPGRTSAEGPPSADEHLAATAEPSPGRRAGCALGLVGAAVAVLAAMVVLGVTSAGRSGASDREALGPIAARYWEAERSRDFATVWMLSERALREAVPQEEFVAHLAACPPRVPPRDVYRMARRADDLWEVEARTAGSYEPTGLQLFRREGEGAFGAVADDADLVEFLATPLPQAVAHPYCTRSR